MNIHTVKNLYDKNTPVMQTKQLVLEALELFDSSKSSAIVIIDDKQHPQGILTERDITKHAGHWDEIISLPVSEVMTSPVTTIGREHDFRDAYMQMTENGFRHLVVVKEDGSFAGVLDEGHFLRHLTPEQLLAVKEVKLVMSKNVTTVETTQSVADTIKIMTEAKISSIIIVRDKKPLGILTERDTIRLARQGDALLKTPITEHMTLPLKTIYEESSVIDAEHILTKGHIRHLVVVNDKGELRGIVSQHDLVKGISGIYVEMLRDTIRKQSNLLHKTYNQLEEQSVLNNIFDSFSDRLIIACDTNSVIEFTNADIFQGFYIAPQIGQKLDENVQCFDSSVSDAVLNGDITSIVNTDPIVYDEKGKKHYFKTSYAPIYSQKKLLQGFLFTAEDVTSQKEEALKKESLQNSLENATKLAQVGTWEWDAINDVTTWDNISYDIFGVKEGSDVNIAVIESLIYKDDIQLHRDVVTKCFEDHSEINFEYRIIKNNEIRIIHALGNVTVKDGNVIKLFGAVQDITDLRANEYKLEEAQKIAKIGSWRLDIVKNRLDWSDEIFNMFEVNKSKFGASYEAFLDAIHPDDRDAVNKAYTQSLQNQLPYSITHRLLMQDGTIKWVVENCTTTFDKDGNPLESIGTVQDVTKQTLFEKQLKDTKKQFQEFYYKTPIMMHAIDKDFKLKEVSNRWLETLGYTREEVIGHDITEFQTAESEKRVKEVYVPELMSTGELRGGELEFYKKSGEIAYLELSAIPEFDEKGEFLHGLGFLIDVTELREKDKILLVQSRQAAMGEMISMIAHQWRQPLSVVSMITNNLQLDIETDMFDKVVAKKDFVQIHDQLKYMSTTIDDFRNFFKHSKEVEKDSVLNILQDIMKIIGTSLNSNSINIEIECDSKLMLQTYKSELKQVIINILSNAKDVLKDTYLENKIIKISVKAENEYILFSIFNNGPKIDSELINKIFEPYFTTKEILGGTGIGLYMSKSIIEKHMHGNIEAKNTNKGVEFTITVPKVLEGTIDE